jgi:cytochrome c-type biogenesis protein CcmH/NrfG
MSLIKKLSMIFLFALLPAIAAADAADSKLLAEGHVDDAIASLQHKVTSSPNDADSFNLLCRAYYSLSDWDKSVSGCEKAVALDPGNAQYHLWLGRSYGEKAEHSGLLAAAKLARKVRNEFETAVRLDPNNVEARADLAEFYMEAPAIMGGGRDKAEAQAQQLAIADPVKAGWLRGQLAEKYEDRGAAENEYRTAIQTSHGAAGAWLNLASFYRRVSRFDLMEDAIAHASSAPMNQPQVLIECAQMLLRSNRNLPEATELLRRYLTSTPNVEAAPAFQAHYLLGRALEQQGDKPGAALEYRASLSLARSFALAQSALDRLNNQVADAGN